MENYCLIVRSSVQGGLLMPIDAIRSAYELGVNYRDAVRWWNAIQAADAPIR